MGLCGGEARPLCTAAGTAGEHLRGLVGRPAGELLQWAPATSGPY